MNNMPYWALIGGSGFIGMAIQNQLTNIVQGVQYGVYSCRNAEDGRALSDLITFDANKAGSSGGVNIVFLSSAGVYKRMNEKAFRFNSIVVPEIAKLLTEMDDSKVLVLGSSFEYGAQGAFQELLSPNSELRPEEDYGKSKKLGFKRLFSHGEPLTNLAYSRVFQVWSELEPSTRLTSLLQANSKRSKITKLKTGKAVRDFVHVDDLAKEIINRFSNWSLFDPITNLSTGRPTTVLDFAERFLISIGQSSALVQDINGDCGIYPRLVGKPHPSSKIPSLDKRI